MEPLSVGKAGEFVRDGNFAGNLLVVESGGAKEVSLLPDRLETMLATRFSCDEHEDTPGLPYLAFKDDTWKQLENTYYAAAHNRPAMIFARLVLPELLEIEREDGKTLKEEEARAEYILPFEAQHMYPHAVTVDFNYGSRRAGRPRVLRLDRIATPIKPLVRKMDNEAKLLRKHVLS